MLFSTDLGSSTLQDSSCMAAYPQSCKPFKTNKHVLDQLISDILWTSTYGQTSIGQTAKIYCHQLYPDTGCQQVNRDGWQKRVKGICYQHTMMILKSKSKLLVTDVIYFI